MANTNELAWQLFGVTLWPVWLFLASLLLSRHDRWSRRFRHASLLLAALMLLSPLGYALLRPLEDAFPVPKLHRAPQGIILLAGAEMLAQTARSGQPEWSAAADRLTFVATLAHRYPGAKIIVAGGVALGKGPVDVDLAAGWLQSVGVEPERIRKIAQTYNTAQNAAAVAPLIGNGNNWVLVTSAFHMPRAMLCFEKQGARPIAFPVDHRLPLKHGWAAWLIPAVSGNLDALNYATHEWIGILLYRLQGQTDRLWPAATSQSQQSTPATPQTAR